VRVVAEHALTWRCARCGGRAVGAAVLRRMAPKARVDALWRKAGEAACAGGGRCPSCELPMRTVTRAAGGREAGADVCCRCQFVWFGAGRLTAFARGSRRSAPGERDRPAVSSDAISTGNEPLTPIDGRDEQEKAILALVAADTGIEVLSGLFNELLG
jgi:Zn-finger nucleic acid-binding protein